MMSPPLCSAAFAAPGFAAQSGFVPPGVGAGVHGTPPVLPPPPPLPALPSAAPPLPPPPPAAAGPATWLQPTLPRTCPAPGQTAPTSAPPAHRLLPAAAAVSAPPPTAAAAGRTTEQDLERMQRELDSLLARVAQAESAPVAAATAAPTVAATAAPAAATTAPAALSPRGREVKRGGRNALALRKLLSPEEGALQPAAPRFTPTPVVKSTAVAAPAPVAKAEAAAPADSSDASLAAALLSEMDTPAARDDARRPHEGRRSSSAQQCSDDEADEQAEAARRAGAIARLAPFVPGRQVRVVGLQSHPDVNGLDGRCIGHTLDDEEDPGQGPAVAVLFESLQATDDDGQDAGQALLLSPKNLKPLGGAVLEMRIDPSDGALYFEAEFLSYYGDEGRKHWEQAQRYDHMETVRRLCAIALEAAGPGAKQAPPSRSSRAAQPSAARLQVKATAVERSEQGACGNTFFCVAVTPANGDQFQVWRRYSAFDQLRERLSAAKLEVAGFPRKTLFRAKGDGLVQRLAQLDAWLSEMVSRCGDSSEGVPDLAEFLSQQNDGGFAPA
eukprot:TRINITY_DN4794_c1_g1_i2.p1 TRINITY_DN4794_c1_g1~~TRINITY_DN4794_c1_g1_i2.p1  ORF type:complete len:556 (+),score=181.71 TRINITY_DN4794_c1_g1_i2:58-1725(+)